MSEWSVVDHKVRHKLLCRMKVSPGPVSEGKDFPRDKGRNVDRRLKQSKSDQFEWDADELASDDMCILRKASSGRSLDSVLDTQKRRSLDQKDNKDSPFGFKGLQVSASVYKTKCNIRWILRSRKRFRFYNFWGDPTDVLATSTALLQEPVIVLQSVHQLGPVLPF